MEPRQMCLRLIGPEFEFENEHGEIIKGSAILAQMKKNQVLKQDSQGQYVQVLFDGRPYVFRHNKALQVGETVARALRRSAYIIVGPKAINGPACPFLEIVREFDISDGGQEIKPQFSCPQCGEDGKTLAGLSRHIASKHKEEVAIQWERPAEAPKPVEEEEVV